MASLSFPEAVLAVNVIFAAVAAFLWKLVGPIHLIPLGKPVGPIHLIRLGKPERRWDHLGRRIKSLILGGILQTKIARQSYAYVLNFFILWAFVLLGASDRKGTR